jgi:hypothetical protein
MTDEAISDEAKIVRTIQHLLFSTSLYADCDLPRETAICMFVKPLSVDGHCFYCQREATFHRSRVDAGLTSNIDDMLKNCNVLHFELSCTRNRTHEVLFFFKINERVTKKIGQYPS